MGKITGFGAFKTSVLWLLLLVLCLAASCNKKNGSSGHKAPSASNQFDQLKFDEAKFQ